MKKSLLSLITAAALIGGAAPSVLSMREAHAACGTFGAGDTSNGGTHAHCSCGGASGWSDMRSATSTGFVGDASGRISSGDNGSNDLQIWVRCYADDGAHYTDRYSGWGGSYAYVACTSSYPYTTRNACRIRS